MASSCKGHLDVVKTLIEAGANVNHSDKVHIWVYICTCTCTLLLWIVAMAACDPTHVDEVLYSHLMHLL